MSKKTRLVVKALGNGFVIMTLAGCLGYFSLSQLKTNAKAIVEDTLPGLSDAGAANAYLGDASRTLLFIVVDNDLAKRKEIREEINQLSDRTTGYLERYGKSIYSPDDHTNFQTLLNERTNYNKIREQVLALAIAGEKEAALSNYLAVMMPAHKHLKTAGDNLFAYNMKQGADRGRRIMTLCTVTQIGLAIVSMLVFLVGFFIGLFK